MRLSFAWSSTVMSLTKRKQSWAKKAVSSYAPILEKALADVERAVSQGGRGRTFRSAASKH